MRKMILMMSVSAGGFIVIMVTPARVPVLTAPEALYQAQLAPPEPEPAAWTGSA